MQSQYLAKQKKHNLMSGDIYTYQWITCFLMRLLVNLIKQKLLFDTLITSDCFFLNLRCNATTQWLK